MSAIEVVAESDGAEPRSESAPEAPSSPLALLRGKREVLNSTLHLDLAVPRWDEVLGVTLWVRYRPGSPAVLANSIEKREKLKERDPDWATHAHADFLVAACGAVYTLPIGTEPPSEMDGLEDYPRFDPELGEALGVTSRSAAAVCRAVYATDGDLVVAAQQLAAWSATAVAKADQDFLDN